MSRLVAEVRVRPGGDVARGEYRRIAGGDELAARDAVAARVANDHVVRDRPAVHEEEGQRAGFRVDRPRVELELGHRDLDRAGRLTAPAPTATAARGHA